MVDLSIDLFWKVIVNKINFLFYSTNSILKENLEKICSSHSFTFSMISSFDEALQILNQQSFQCVMVDLDDATLKPLSLLEWIQSCCLFARVGILIQKTYKPEFLLALRLGVREIITSPEYQSVSILTEKLQSVSRDIQTNIKWREFAFLEQKLFWIGQHPETCWLWDQMKSLASLSFPVLLSGESGVGKKHLAKVLASESGSKFVGFDAALIPDYEQKKLFHELMDQTKKEKILLCVNEVSMLHPELQEYMLECMLHTKNLQLPCESWRLVALTSRDLQDEVDHGRLREDLYLILKERCYSLSPLRDRKQDIETIVEFILQSQLRPVYFSKDAMVALTDYEWPGNTAQLFDVIQWILSHHQTSLIQGKVLPQEILKSSFYRSEAPEDEMFKLSYNDAKKRVLNKFNRTYMTHVIKQSDDNLTVAAEKAGMDRSNFKKIMKKYGLE